MEEKERNSLIYNMDCMEGVKEFPDGWFDLAVVDVPYGIDINNQSQGKGGGVARKIDYEKKDWDKVSPSDEYWSELFRITKHQIIWGANHFISKIPFDSSCWLVWDKDNGDADFADCELAWTSYKTAVRKFKYTWAGMRQENMKNKEERTHPTQKPISLYDWIYKKYLPNGGRVIDTHLSSASNRIAAYNQGNIDFVGYELDPDYFATGKARYDAHVLKTEEIKKFGYAKTAISLKSPTLF